MTGSKARTLPWAPPERAALDRLCFLGWVPGHSLGEASTLLVGEYREVRDARAVAGIAHLFMIPCSTLASSPVPTTGWIEDRLRR